ncbi:MAG TPA: protein kinase [Longimicrobium sp.]|nr:protein kinase [Longimicrobium sp.]
MSNILPRFLRGRALCNRYRLDDVIGQGGMGAVFRATDEQLDRQVAIKLIAVQAETPEQEEHLRSRFRHEARTAARLNNPHVVTIHDIGRDDETGLDFIVMELLDGEDLHRRIRRDGRLAPPLAQRLIGEAAEGLAAGHRLGLVHRDVKPANLFLVGEAGKDPRRVVVLDFGIAQVTDEARTGTATHLTLFGRAPLSPGYAAPEQLRESTRLTAACDVFGLGVTAFQALTGVLPFSDADRVRLAAGEAVAPPPLRDHAPEVPVQVERVIRQALASDPAERFPDAGAFRDALRAAIDAAAGGETILVPAPPDDPPGAEPPKRPAPPSRRHPSPRPGVGVDLVEVVINGVLLLVLASAALTYGPDLLRRADEWLRTPPLGTSGVGTTGVRTNLSTMPRRIEIGGDGTFRLFSPPRPRRLTLPQGGWVEFAARDTASHIIVFRDSASGRFGPPRGSVRVPAGGRATFRAALLPGTYSFRCRLHPALEAGGYLVLTPSSAVWLPSPELPRRIGETRTADMPLPRTLPP